MKCIPKRWKSGTKKRDRNWDPFLEPASKIPILAGIPRPPKTVPFLGPHFGGGEPLSSSFFGTKIWISYQEVPSNVTSSSARMQLYTSRNSRLDTACLEHIFASKTVKSVDVFSRVAALTVSEKIRVVLCIQHNIVVVVVSTCAASWGCLGCWQERNWFWKCLFCACFVC